MPGPGPVPEWAKTSGQWERVRLGGNPIRPSLPGHPFDAATRQGENDLVGAEEVFGDALGRSEGHVPSITLAVPVRNRHLTGPTTGQIRTPGDGKNELSPPMFDHGRSSWACEDGPRQVEVSTG